MNFFKADIKRIFTEQSFWLSIVLGAVLLFGGLGYCLSAEDFKEDANVLYSRAQALALPFAAPLLAAMPYSVMIMTERETKFGALMILKQSGTHKQRKQSRHYRIKRFFTVGYSASCASRDFRLWMGGFILRADLCQPSAVRTPRNAAGALSSRHIRVPLSETGQILSAAGHLAGFKRQYHYDRPLCAARSTGVGGTVSDRVRKGG